jgi:hypothetical protein
MMAKENVIIALIYLKRTGDALDKYRPWCKFDQEHSYFTRCFQQRRVHLFIDIEVRGSCLFIDIEVRGSCLFIDIEVRGSCLLILVELFTIKV